MSWYVAASRIPTSRSRSVLAELKPLPWLYPYREDPYFTRLDQPIFRPFVEVSLAHAGETTTVLDGLVDKKADFCAHQLPDPCGGYAKPSPW